MKNNISKLILFLSVLFLFIVMFFLRHYLSVFYFQNDINRVSVNVEVKKNIDDVYICFDLNCDKTDELNRVYSYKLNQENPLFYRDIKNIELIFKDKNSLLNVENISVFNGKKFEYYSVSDLAPDEVEFQNKTRYSLNLPFEGNSKTVFNKIGVYFESLFYNWYFYLITYVLIILYFSFFAEEKKFNFKTKCLIYPVLFLSLVLNLSHIDFIPLWNDELYTFSVISNCASGFNFLNTFSDPGNPPLFFIVSNIWLKFFNSSVFLIRLLPSILGVLLVYNVFFVLKRVINEKTALIASFLTSINLFIIMQSNEIRCYIFAMNLVLIGGYAFYKLYEKFDNKNLVFYFLTATCLINTHFYAFLFALFNFVFGLILFKLNRVKFLISNIFSFLTFLIYFIYSYKISLSKSFNVWLPKPGLDVILNHITFYFGNLFWFFVVLFFCCFIFKKLPAIQRKIFLYFISAISFVFLFSLCFSFLIKPILFERYFCIFLPFLIIITSMFLTLDYQTKLKPLILTVIFLISVNIPKYENFNLFSNIFFMVKYSTIDY